MGDDRLPDRSRAYAREPEDVLRDAGFILDDDGNVIGHGEDGGDGE